MFLRMPFGLSPAPWIFTRLIKAIKRFLKNKGVNINSVIDVFIIQAKYHPLAAIYMNWMKHLLTWLGLTVNVKKSSIAPYIATYPIIGSDFGSLPPHPSTSSVQGQEASALTASASCSMRNSRRMLQCLVGLIMLLRSIIPLSRMNVNTLIMWLNKYISTTARYAVIVTNTSLLQILGSFHKFIQRCNPYVRVPSHFYTIGSTY